MGACFSRYKYPGTSTSPNRQSTSGVHQVGPPGSANEEAEGQVEPFRCESCTLWFSQLDRVEFDCGHVSCKTCVGETFAYHIMNGDLDRLKCFKAGCVTMAGNNLVRRMVSDSSFRIYSAAMLMLERQPGANILQSKCRGFRFKFWKHALGKLPRVPRRLQQAATDRLARERALQAADRHSHDSKTTVPEVSNKFKGSISLEMSPVSTGIHFGCEHIHCSQCIRTHFEVKVKEGDVHGFQCPEQACNVEADNGMIRRVLDEETFKKYDEILLSDVISREIPETVLCPVCQKWVPASPECGYCDYSNYAFCTDCSKAYHGLDPCVMTEEQLRSETERLYAAQTAEEWERISRELEAQRNLHQDSDRLIKEVYKKCPNSNCRAKIEKNEICNQMHCIRCGTHFCWLCLAFLDTDEPRKHYNEPGSKCLLFYFPV